MRLKWVFLIALLVLVGCKSSFQDDADLIIGDSPIVASREPVHRLSFENFNKSRIEYVQGKSRVVNANNKTLDLELRRDNVKLGDAMTVRYVWNENKRDLVLSNDHGKVRLDSSTKAVRIYDLPPSNLMEGGGMEYEVLLKSIPSTNVFVFNVSSRFLNFYYQPPLDEEHFGSDLDCNATHCFLNDSLFYYRPENVVGSYAVYYENDLLIGSVRGTGKAYHIFRPRVVDSSGDEIWGVLNFTKLSGGGFLSVTVDDKWLSSADYPVVVDPTFGYTTAGGSSQSIKSIIAGGKFNIGSSTGGVLHNISAYIDYSTGSGEP